MVFNKNNQLDRVTVRGVYRAHSLRGVVMTKRMPLFVLALAGCSAASDPVPGGELPGSNTPGSNAPGSNTPGSNTPGSNTPAVPLTAEQQEVRDAVQKDLMQRLEDTVGQFVAGKSPVFRGWFSAHDNLGSVPFNHQDGVMTDAEVIAILESREDLWTGQAADRGVRLFMVSESQGKSLVLTQHEKQAGVTHVSMVLPKSPGGLEAACSGCVAPLTSATTSIEVQPLVAQGKWGDGSLMQVTAHGMLSRVAPAQLTFDDLLSIARSDYRREDLLRMFSASGSERTQTITGTYRKATAVPSGTLYAQCERLTSYSVELYVGTPIVSFGVRGFSAMPTQTCCLDQPKQACDLQTPTCF